MDEILKQLATDPLGRLMLQYLATGGLKGNYLFLLVGARLAGVFLVAPYFVTTMIPVSVRFGLIFFLSLIITPALSGITPGEGSFSLVSFESATSGSLQATLMDFGCQIVNEIGLGTLLGVGTIAVLSGFRLGGEWLDRQTGLGVGAMLNPEGAPEMVQRNSLVELLGIVVFLTIKPLGGLTLLLQSLLQSFQSIPVGSATWVMSLKEIVSALIQQSFVLGLRVAMPLIAAITLVDVAIAFVGRDTPLSFGFYSLIIRTSLSMIFLALTMTVLPDIVMTASSSVFRSLLGFR